MWPWVGKRDKNWNFLLILRGMRNYGWHKSKITFASLEMPEPKRVHEWEAIAGLTG